MLKSSALISKFTVEINPDCIKVSPFNDKIFCIGHYHQIQGQNIQGAISILDVDNNAFELNTTSATAILHLCWLNYRINGKIFILAACRNSTIKIFEYSEPLRKILEHKTIEVDTIQSYCLYLDCLIVDGNIHVIVSTNKSEVFFYILDSQFSIKEKFQYSDHQYAVWCCRINPFSPSTFLSGDEISNLILYDIRSNPQKILKNSKIHENGVSDICFTNRQHQLLTGTFDGVLRWFDARYINKSMREYKTEGVIWRIIPAPNNKQLLLCLSSLNTFEILNIETNEKSEIKQHQSLAYAADWSTNNIVTASFYDKLICIWQK